MVRILAFQASGPGSIPGRRTYFGVFTILRVCGVAALMQPIQNALLAQMVERKTLNLVVAGSIPAEGAFLLSRNTLLSAQQVNIRQT